MLKVYIADVSTLDVERDYPLSDYRRKKLEKQKLLTSRKLGIGAELLLIHALEEIKSGIMPPLDIICGKDGKPELTGGGVYFNLSHSGSFAACAVSDSPVGIDIQTEQTNNEKLALRSFSDRERDFIQKNDNSDSAYTQIWSMKESCIKLFGTGFRTPMNSFSVDADNLCCELNGQKLYFYNGAFPGYNFSVCTESKNSLDSLTVSLTR